MEKHLPKGTPCRGCTHGREEAAFALDPASVLLTELPRSSPARCWTSTEAIPVSSVLLGYSSVWIWNMFFSDSVVLSWLISTQLASLDLSKPQICYSFFLNRVRLIHCQQGCSEGGISGKTASIHSQSILLCLSADQISMIYICPQIWSCMSYACPRIW